MFIYCFLNSHLDLTQFGEDGLVDTQTHMMSLYNAPHGSQP